MTIATYEPSTELVTTTAQDPTGGRLVAWAESLSAAHQLASALCRTSFVPKHFAGKPEEAAAALMLGDELGLTPVSALRSIFVISGTPGLYAKTMVALVQSRGHQIWTETDTAARVVVCGQRAGTDHVERVEWTIDRARRAGYTNNKKYETDPQAMLYARAASDVCRKIAADVLAGVPLAVEELELENAGATTRKTTVKRSAPQPPEPDLEPPAPQADANAPEGITPPQLKKIGAAMRDLGITDRALALAFVADVIGREVESRNDLTRAEAHNVIEALERDLAPTKDAPEPELDDPTTNPSWGQR